jgi:hypothetical protein
MTGDRGGLYKIKWLASTQHAHVNQWDAHMTVSTSLDIRSSTVPTRDPFARGDDKVFGAERSSLTIADDRTSGLTTFW